MIQVVNYIRFCKNIIVVYSYSYTYLNNEKVVDKIIPYSNQAV